MLSFLQVHTLFFFFFLRGQFVHTSASIVFYPLITPKISISALTIPRALVPSSHRQSGMPCECLPSTSDSAGLYLHPLTPQAGRSSITTYLVEYPSTTPPTLKPRSLGYHFFLILQSQADQFSLGIMFRVHSFPSISPLHHPVPNYRHL